MPRAKHAQATRPYLQLSDATQFHLIPVAKDGKHKMHAFMSVKKQQEKVVELEADVDRLQSQLGEHENADEIVKRHIKLLHQYNEVKDATQILIGRLAAWKETTIRQVHKDYDLEDSD